MLTLRTSSLALSLIGLLSGVARADNPGVVVLGFEGDGSQAQATRGAIIELVSRDYGVVAPRRWREALESNDETRPASSWAGAAHDVGAVAVIEGKVTGKVTRAGRGRRLRLVVRDAHSGKTVGDIEAPLDKDGLSSKAKSALEVELTDTLFLTTGNGPAESAEAPVEVRARRGKGKGRRSGEVVVEEVGDGVGDGDGESTAQVGDVEAPRLTAETRVDIAAAHAGVVTQDRLSLFEAPKGDGSGLPEGTATATAAVASKRTAIADVALTGFATSRQFGFSGAVLPSDYPGATVTGLAIAGSVYPMSKADGQQRLNGPGLSAALGTSVASDVPVAIDDEVFDFPVSQRSLELAAHYRYPAGPALVDGHIGYASLTHYIEDIPEDAPEELDLLDAEYSYLDVGGRVEVEAGPRTTLGFALSYLYMTQLGLLTDPDMLGGAQSWGLELGLDLKVALGHRVFAAAGADYRRINLTFDGDGAMYDDLGIDVDDAKDTFIGGHLQVGVGF